MNGMKRVGVILTAVVLLVALVTGGLVWRGSQLLKSDSAPTPITKHWGVLIRPFALVMPETEATYDWRPSVRQQLDDAHTLGVTTIKVDLESDFRMTYELLSMIKAAGFETVLIVDRGDKDFASTSTDFTALGQQLGDAAAIRFAGVVDVWQLANEVSGSAVHQPSDTGATLTNRYNLTYDQNRYNNVRNYTKAMGLAIRAHDPNAKLMLTGHWVLVDIFPRLVADGVPFDIVGWDWYSDQGTDPSNKVVDGQGSLNLPQFFNAMGKQFWLAEVNRESGSYDGHQADQATWIGNVAKVVANGDQISGMVVFMLGDIASEVANNAKTGYLGLIEINRFANGTATFGTKKPAFAAYQSAIQTYGAKQVAATKTGLDRLAVQTARFFGLK